jgi:hypothetical protein
LLGPLEKDVAFLSLLTPFSFAPPESFLIALVLVAVFQSPSGLIQPLSASEPQVIELFFQL